MESRICSSVAARLNSQVSVEFNSALIYLAFSVWSEAKGYLGFAKKFRSYYKEELSHMEKVVDYVLDRGGVPLPPKQEKQELEFDGGMMSVLEQALNHEKFVTDSYNDLYSFCESENDNVTGNFVTWFIGEQVEEEKKFMDMISAVSLYGNDNIGLMELDEEFKK